MTVAAYEQARRLYSALRNMTPADRQRFLVMYRNADRHELGDL